MITEITFELPKKIVKLDLNNHKIILSCGEESTMNFIENLSENDTDEFYDTLKELMKTQNKNKTNNTYFQVAMRLNNNHIKLECIISFTSKTSCIVIIQKFECVDVDSYLDYLNEIKK